MEKSMWPKMSLTSSSRLLRLSRFMASRQASGVAKGQQNPLHPRIKAPNVQPKKNQKNQNKKVFLHLLVLKISSDKMRTPKRTFLQTMKMSTMRMIETEAQRILKLQGESQLVCQLCRLITLAYVDYIKYPFYHLMLYMGDLV